MLLKKYFAISVAHNGQHAAASGRRIPSRYQSIAVIVAAFALSRMLTAAAGVHFIIDILHVSHFADPVLLRDHLLQTLLYLHTQPPFLNMVIGIVLKIFPDSYGTVFHLIWMAMGLFFSIVLHELMVGMGVSRWIALLLTVVFVISPAMILYENYFFYDHFLLVGATVAAWLLYRYLSAKKIYLLVLFFSVISAIVLTRSLFHIAWMASVIIMLLVLCRDDWRRILLAAIIPFMLALSVYVKNQVVFGSFSSSTWLGMSLARISTQQLDSNERQRMARCGEISRISLIPAFSEYDYYRNIIGKSPAAGIPVLDQVAKSSGNEPVLNFNNIDFIDISRQYERDAKHVIATHPGVIVKSVSLASFYYSYPASTLYYMVDSNRVNIVRYERLFDIFVYGQFYDYQHASLKSSGPDQYGVPKIFKVSLFLLIGSPLLIFYGFRLFRRGLRLGSEGRPCTITLGFILGTILWIMAIGILLEVGENYRFRYTTEPWIFLLLGLFLSNRPWKRNAGRKGGVRDDS
ncbi:MAG: hypothetical protein ABIR47_06815, partial [Candidatus Kapaibacterium sp.]